MARKTRQTRPQDPPGVAEVRRWRAKLMKRAGGTIQGLMAYLDQRADAKMATAPQKKAGLRSSRGKAA
jgi:hypothetical protein